MIQIAIYGKGGIGKSTVSANISYSLADKGTKVLQIGCDPKHDSTRALLQGREQATVLNYIRSTPPYDRKLEDIVLDGVKGIKCVEAGGPEPGIGCAGRGILSTFDTLKKLGLDDMKFDVKIYDVLGDVVCGGFAVPLRNEYADGVYLVTSGEFMSIYAANNILKGIKNFDKGVPRVAGIILNCRGVENEYETVKRFADAVELPLVACIPRSKLFADSEAAGKTVMEMFPDSDVAKELEKISDNIISIMDGRSSPFDSNPLNDAQMEQIAKGETVKKNEKFDTVGSGAACRGCIKAPKVKVTTEKNVVGSCATAGAVYGCSSVIDSVVIVHGPRSCAHIMSSSRNISEIRKGSGKTGKGLQSMRIVSTDMDDTISVFGGAGLLEEKIRNMILEGHKSIFVVTSCVSGIIGDNAIDVVNAISNENPDVYFRVVEADGNILGEWEVGFAESANALLDMVDDTLEPREDTVNILAERYLFRQGEDTENEVYDLFRPYGIKINCRFMYESSMDSIRNFRLGKTNYIIDNDRSSMKIAKLVSSKLNVPVDTEPLPIGIREHGRFSEKIGKELGMQEKATAIAAEEENRYSLEISKIRPKLEGKKVLIEDRFTQNIDWLVELVSDLGMEVLAVGIGPTHHWKEKRAEPKSLPKGVPIKHDYLLEDLLADVESFSPDIVLTDSGLMELDGIRSAMYSRPAPGINSVLRFGRKMGDLVSVPATEGWRKIQ
ncbi:MAG: AAA family ATPase [Methanomassiliicoccaceae archaeon]|nr:AAA family ATPase [Methanomassiliicoccaceae archaeon]